MLSSFSVNTASAERRFLFLRRINTWLRTNITNERLSRLALIYSHRDTHICEDNVTDMFSRETKKNIL